MDIFSILTMIGGLALFLYGMTAMGEGLTKFAGGKLEILLERLTSKKIFAVLLGAGVTAVIQSSSATTVMVVGFVNSGIMKLQQTVGIIMGANIGTTITSWILSLTGIEGDAVWVKLLKPSSFSPLLAAAGIILLMTAKGSDRKKDIGSIFLGFAILMFGMETMSDAVKPLADNEKFTGILTTFSFPLLGLAAGAILTAIIQSSSASVGILQALCLSGVVSYATAIPIIMGQNIGTCVTSIISSVGASKNAKRAAMIHLYFNLIGTIIFMTVFYIINAVIPFDLMDDSASAFGIAVIHSLFNVTVTVVLYPFANLLVKLATATIREEKEPVAPVMDSNEEAPANQLDERFLSRPAFAMEMAKDVTIEMARETEMAVDMALNILTNYDAKHGEEVIHLEQRVDQYEDKLSTYLVKLSSKNLSKRDSRIMSVLLHSINDLERISDHAINLQESAYAIYDKNMEFSDSAKEELSVICRAVRDIVQMTVRAFSTDDIEGAEDVEPLEEYVDRLTKEIKQRHVMRLRQGKCTIELGLVLEDILTILERISDHCSNIAVAMIEIQDDQFDGHGYLERLNKGEGSVFYEKLMNYQSVYRLPINDGTIS